jgi:hypothetical protein
MVLAGFLRPCASIIRKIFSYICTYSLKSAIYPDRLKYSIVRPIYKKNDKLKMTNYKPVPLRTTFSKILEIIIFNRKNQHSEVTNLLVPE